MASYVVTGASRGIGLGFVKALSADPSNTVIGIIRNAATASALYSLAKSASNIHVVVAEITDAKQVEAAAAEVGAITGGKLDVLINNAGGVGPDGFKLPGSYVGAAEQMKSEFLETMDINYWSAIYTTDAFLPLIRKGNVKKIICISSGMADEDIILTCELAYAVGYSTAKAALNTTVAKYAVQFKGEGILFSSISPGWVKTEAATDIDEGTDMMLAAFQKVDPSVTGMISVEESVKDQLAVIDRLTAQDSGKFVSHHGNKKWF